MQNKKKRGAISNKKTTRRFEDLQSDEETEEEIGMEEEEEEDDDDDGEASLALSTQRRSRSPVKRVPSLPANTKAKAARGGKHVGLPPPIERKRSSTPIPVTRSPPKKHQVVIVDVEDQKLSTAAMVSSPSSLRTNVSKRRQNEPGEGPSRQQVVRKKHQGGKKPSSLPPVDEDEEPYLGSQVNPWSRLDDFTEDLTNEDDSSLNVSAKSSSRVKKPEPTLGGSDEEESFLAPSSIGNSTNSSLNQSEVVEIDDENDDGDDDGGAHDRRRLALIAKLSGMVGCLEQKTT